MIPEAAGHHAEENVDAEEAAEQLEDLPPMSLADIDDELDRAPPGLRGGELSTWFARVLPVLAVQDPIVQDDFLNRVRAKCGAKKSALEAILKAWMKQAAASMQEARLSQGGFARGDHVEIAERALESLRGDSPEAPIFADGHLYRVDADTSLWKLIEQDEQCRAVIAFANSHQLEIDAKDMSGAVKVAHQLAGRSRFFAEGVTGIAFRNGIVVWDGRDMAWTRLRPEHRVRVALPFSYRSNARARRFHKFLRQCFRGDRDIEGKIRLLQEFAGACLLGVATKFCKVMVLLGAGSNGKSVFLKVLAALFPAAARASVTPQKLESDYHVARLVGARVNIVAELPEAELLESETLKAIVSGDEVMARQPYKEVFQFAPIAGHVFAANRLPSTSDVTHGFWRRFLVVEWPREFAEEDQDADLADRLVSNEMPGIAAWAVRGARHVLVRGRYEVPESVAMAVATWRSGADSVALFVADWTVPASHDHPSTQFRKDVSVLRPWTTASGLYELFKVWADKNGHKRLSSKTFGDRLTAMKVPKVKRSEATYYGLASKDGAICRRCQQVSREGIEHDCG